MGDGKINEKRVLKATSLRAMQKPGVAASDRHHVGLSWFLSKEGGLKIVSHGGATNGQHSGLWFIPEAQFALTWLTNSSETRVENLLEAALKIYFDLSITKPEPLSLPLKDVQDYLGSYENIESILTISEKKGALWLSFEHKGGFPMPDSPPLPVPPPTRIGFYSEDKFIVLKGAYKGDRGEFLRASDGTLEWMRFAHRIHRKTGGTHGT